MRFSKTLAIVTCLVLAVLGLYAVYEALGINEANDVESPVPDLETLLSDHSGVQIFDILDRIVWDALVGEVTAHDSWQDFESRAGQKGLTPNWETLELFSAEGEGWAVYVFTIRTDANGKGIWETYTYVKDMDDPEDVLVRETETNVGMVGVVGADDPVVSEIPVYVWSNGMPVYFITIRRWFGPGIWVPYHYWWYDSHNHPNWYYGYYNWWWWYHRWYGYPWKKWYNWYYAWYYWHYFYYWSTYFPY